MTRYVFMLALSLATALGGCGDASDLKDEAARLYLREMQDEWEVELSLGSELTIDDESYRVESIRPWRGLLRVDDGRPMVSISLRPEGGDWEQDVFLAEGQWARIGSSISVGLYWWDSEEEARRMAERPIAELPSARWGIPDGSRIHWFSTFEPGTGVTRKDGVGVTLIGRSFETDPPIIVLLIEDGDSRSRAIIAAETHAEGAPAIYEDAALRDQVVVLNGWRDGDVVVSYYRDGNSTGTRLVESGATWDPGLAIRLEQAQRRAAPVTEEASELWEVVLSTEGRRFRIREAELTRIAEAAVRVVVSAKTKSLAARE